MSTMTYQRISAPLQQVPETAEQACAEEYYDIVVVDDEKAIAQVIADLLAEEGYSVRVFHDGASALLDILEHPPLLVLLDITMPVMRGDELLKELRNGGYDDLPIVLMSAGTHLNDFLKQGATDVIPKPFDIDQLLACVEAQTRADSE